MKIIKVNDNQEKLKYEIYSMQLKQEQARRYREEQAKKIQFYRLNVGIPFETDIFKKNFIERISSYQQTKTICELTQIPISDKKVVYGDDFSPDSSSLFTLSPYYHTYYDNETDIIKKGNQQQKEFLENFIEYGLTKYHLNPRREFDLNSYIFLNPFINSSQFETFGTFGYSDNFIFLPHAIMALEMSLYLLKNDLPAETLYYYTDYIADPKDRISFSEIFHFNKEETITKEKMENLMNGDLTQKELLTRELRLGSTFGDYIK